MRVGTGLAMQNEEEAYYICTMFLLLGDFLFLFKCFGNI
jgi:hypothetical protein